LIFLEGLRKLGEARDSRTQKAVGQGDAQRTADLRRLVQPFVLRRVKTDKSVISDLPDKIEHTVYCNLTREQATLYQAVTRDMLERVQDAIGLQRG
jgi:SNF2 family DNA or RNA helicase